MRAIAQIDANVTDIRKTMKGLSAQIDLLENTYQANAVKMTGSRYKPFDELIEDIKRAREALNELWRMEIEDIEELKESMPL